MTTPDEIMAGATAELGARALRTVLRHRWHLTFADGTSAIVQQDPGKLKLSQLVRAERLPLEDKWID